MKLVCYFLVITLAYHSRTAAQDTTAKHNTNPSIQTKPKAYVLGKNEGEILKDAQGRTNILKVTPETGAAHLSVGLQQMPKGSGIIIHRHDHTEEVLFVHRGRGIAIINGDSVNIDEGSTIFIPPGVWHGVQNPSDSMSILFIVTPPGLEKLFRGIGSPPGSPLKNITPQQRDSIGVISDSKVKRN